MSSLNELFKKLDVYSAGDQHKEVLETSYEILKSSPHDARAFRLTVVSAINLDQYLTAFKVFKNYPQAQTGDDDLALEKLYVHYKLNLNKELEALFEELGDKVNDNKGLLYLKAQFLYRLGHYEQSLDTYHELINSTIDEEDPEILDLSVNERAILADGYQLGKFNRFNSKLPLTPDREDSYDLIFNEALIHLGLKNYSKALQLLDVAEEKAVEANPDSEDQVNETFPIQLQKAYIYHITGETSKAEDIYNSFDRSKLSDELNTLVLNNNLLATNQSTQSSGSFALKELEFPNILNKLSPRFSILQTKKLFKNYARLSAGVGKKVHSADSKIDLTSNSLASLNKAEISVDQEDPATQAKKAYKYAIASKDLPASLTAAQLNVNVGNLDAAASVLENLDSNDKLLPAVSSALLNIYDKLGSFKKKIALFNEIHESYSSKTEFPNIDEYDFIKILSLNFYSLETKKAQNLLTKLNTYQEDDLISLVLAQGSSDSTKLQPVEELTEGLNEEDLITKGIERLSKESIIAPSTSKVVKKRVRKNKKLPKSFDENKLPDPERWLPLKDRSTYRPKKGKKKNNKETQGGSADNITEESVVSKSKNSNPAPKKSKKKGRK